VTMMFYRSLYILLAMATLDNATQIEIMQDHRDYSKHIERALVRLNISLTSLNNLFT
jgi:hypothetical protein